MPTIAAFDAKQFRRGKQIIVLEGEKQVKKDAGFNSQLGAGIIVSDPNGFTEHYISANQDLMKSFGIDMNLPFFASNHLKNISGIRKTIAFADQLISKIQKYIESIHISYVILPPTKTKPINVGGLKNITMEIGPRQFIDNLGPMFSYLTAHSYLWMNKYQNTADLEIYIDAFRSRQTKAWDRVSNHHPKIFTHGDECNPFISCADIIAFLTDVKLYGQHLHLNIKNIEKIWNEYSFDVTTQFFDKNNLHYYTWKSDSVIDLSNHLARPTIFLAIDNIEVEEQARIQEQTDIIESALNKPRKFNRVIKQSLVYYAALNYAFQKNGCLKIFSKTEDMALVRDGDVFVYVGTDSERIGKSLQHSCRLEILSGLEIRDLTEK